MKSLEEYAMKRSPFKSTIRKVATSGWAVTRKRWDQVALVVSVWQGPISGSRAKKKRKISLVSDNPDVLQLQLRPMPGSFPAHPLLGGEKPWERGCTQLGKVWCRQENSNTQAKGKFQAFDIS